jgi:hypothetical protein
MVEVKVNPETAPYLVSSTRHLWWAESSKEGIVRVGINSAPLDKQYTWFVEAVAKRGLDDAWGNVHPNNHMGYQLGLEHLRDYGFDDIQVWTSPNSYSPPNAKEVAWLPPGYAVMFPVDMDYVGHTLIFGDANYATILHNVARGIVVLLPVDGERGSDVSSVP